MDEAVHCENGRVDVGDIFCDNFSPGNYFFPCSVWDIGWDRLKGGLVWDKKEWHEA